MAKASLNGLSSDLSGGADTIVARATAPGRGALAVIRVSGPGAAEIAHKLCPQLPFSDAWKAALVSVLDREGAFLERAVAIPFPGPRSYTGEDMFELTVHGSPYLVEAAIVQAQRDSARREVAVGDGVPHHDGDAVA